jgi:small GTP-binding protein
VPPDWANRLITFKICLLGDPCVGKTSLFLNFKSGCNGTGPLVHAQTIGADFVALNCPLVELPERVAIQLMVFDTAGQEKFRTITRSYLTQADLIIMVYDINNDDTKLNILQYWYNEVRDSARGHSKTPKFVVVGNKLDLYKTPGIKDALKQQHMHEFETAWTPQIFDETNFHFVSARSGLGVINLLQACKRICTEGSRQVENARAACTPDQLRKAFSNVTYGDLSQEDKKTVKLDVKSTANGNSAAAANSSCSC